MKKIRRTAKFIQTLVYYDGPQLVLLKARKTTVVAMAIDKDDLIDPFVAVTVTPKDWLKYLRGAADLRYLFEYPKTRRIYIFDANELQEDQTVKMSPWGDEPIGDFLPEPQFFSSNHTEEIDGDALSKSINTFQIDGSWDLKEFGNFYSRFGDAYSFSMAMSKLASSKVSDNIKRKIIDIIGDYPWRGGSSYLHFFGKLSDILSTKERLAVKSMQYASPGAVEVRGDQSGFDAVNELLKTFDERRDEIAMQYAFLHGYLSKNKYLKESAKNFDQNGSVAKFIMGEAEKLSDLIGFKDFEAVRRLADGNALVVAKIVLAYQRRISNTFDFYAEGRIEMPN